MPGLVELGHLKYIVSLAGASNITRTPEQLFLTQVSLRK
jgi:hypothetical protein